MMTQIDWSRINWARMFGTVLATEELKGNQYKFMKSDIQERSLEKWSYGQLNYVGNTQKGKDFIGIDDYRYENKAMKGLIQKTVPWTKPIILKNFHGNNTGVPEQTFDYMIALDTAQRTVLLADWAQCMRMAIVKDATVETRLVVDECQILAQNVMPDIKALSNNIKEEYNKFINNFI